MVEQKNMRCPKCKSTLFHIQEVDGLMMLCCYKTGLCKWSIPITPIVGKTYVNPEKVHIESLKPTIETKAVVKEDVMELPYLGPPEKKK